VQELFAYTPYNKARQFCNETFFVIKNTDISKSTVKRTIKRFKNWKRKKALNSKKINQRSV